MKVGFIRAARRGALLAVLTMFGSLAGVCLQTASAQLAVDPDYWNGTQERRETVYRFVYGESPQPIPSAYDDVREAEEALDERQLLLPPTNPAARSLWQQIRTLPVRTALSTPQGLIGTAALGGLAGYIGVKIGSGIYAKYIEIKVPEPAPWNPSAPQRIIFAKKGSFIYTGLTMPYDGWLWQWWLPYPAQSWRAFWVTPMGAATPIGCSTAQNPTSIPEGFLEVLGDPHPNCGSGGGGNGGVAHAAVLPEEGLGAHGPIQDYTNQPFDKQFWPGSPPPQTTVEQSIETELDKPENQLLRDWLNYQLGSPGAEDPTGMGQPNPDFAPGQGPSWCNPPAVMTCEPPATMVATIADELVAQNWETESPPRVQVETIARECLRLTYRALRRGDVRCKQLPLLVTGTHSPTGLELSAISDHDLDAVDPTRSTAIAQGAHPSWVFLNWENGAVGSPKHTLQQRRWYTTTPPCIEGSYDTTIDDCDEYPFWSTEQGGAFGRPWKPSLRPLSYSQNRSQGAMVTAFGGACSMKTGPTSAAATSNGAGGDAFIHVIIPKESAVTVPSMPVCNGKTS